MAKKDEYSEYRNTRVREIFRDETLWVLDKPAGTLSHPNPPAKRAANALIRGDYDYDRELYRVRPKGGGRQLQVHLAHRLDQETSGLIVCTFTPDAAARIREGLYRGDIEKEYRALVLGEPRARQGEWHDRLEKRTERGRVTVRVVDGRPDSTTRYRVIESFEASGLALLSLRPETGRTHQLRVQAASRHLPILGDERYGDFNANRFVGEELGLRHMFLHAFRLRLRHPVTGHLMRFEAPFTSRLAKPLAAARELRKRVPRRG